jgi:acetylornithine deacetylase/succinyl-diaminopimelate desuccinylase-like protein
LLEGGHADNALPQRAQATINCRILPSDNPQAILETLITVVGDPQVNIKSIYPAIASPSSPLTPEVLGSIEAVSEEMWPGVPVMATMSTGATDGLYLRNAGIPVYGVSGIFHETSDNRSHGQNERMRIQSFLEGQQFLYRLTKRLSSEDQK